MKTLAATFFLLLALALQSAYAETITRPAGTSNPAFEYDDATCMYSCPSTYPHQIGPSEWDGAVACDPAFITYDRALVSLRKAVDTAKTQESPAIGNAASEVAKALTKALDEAKTPDRAWAVAMNAWRSSVSSAFQRQALALVRSMSKSPADAEAVSFMLSALENPPAQMERCRELGRGTAIERKTAADRLALLLQNPNLADRLK